MYDHILWRRAYMMFFEIFANFYIWRAYMTFFENFANLYFWWAYMTFFLEKIVFLLSGVVGYVYDVFATKTSIYVIFYEHIWRFRYENNYNDFQNFEHFLFLTGIYDVFRKFRKILFLMGIYDDGHIWRFRKFSIIMGIYDVIYGHTPL